MKLKSNAKYIGILTIIICSAGLNFLLASDEIPGEKQKHPIALVGGTIHTVSGSTLANGAILFDKGKITAIGEKIELPDSTEKIDITGKHVYPGLIAANTCIGLVEISAVRSTRDFAEVGDIKPNIRAESAINPDSEIIPVTRANGITIAHSIPMGGLISGTSAAIMLDGWSWEDLTLRAPIGLAVNWPSMRTRSRRPGARTSDKDLIKRRDANIQKIRDLFADARAYLKAQETEVATGSLQHASDIRLEALAPVLNREIPALISAYTIKEIEAAIDWASDENIDVVLMSGTDVRFALDLLKEKKIPVIYTAVLSEPMRRWEPYDTAYKIPAELYKAGIKFCIATAGDPFSAAHERNLPYHAAMAAAFGLPKAQALKSITLEAAQILGIADRVGSLDTGKDATLIVTNGDPLEIRTQVEMEFIQGRKVQLTSRHTRLNEKYKTKYSRMK